MKMITGFLRPDAGSATVDGIDVTRDPVAVKGKLGYLPESAPAYPEMTVEEFLGFIAEIRGYREPAARAAQVDRAACAAEAHEDLLRQVRHVIGVEAVAAEEALQGASEAQVQFDEPGVRGAGGPWAG